MARLNDQSLTSVAQDLHSGASPEKLAAHITAPLSNAQRRILSALSIFSGAPVQATTLSELLQIDDAETILEELEERHLVHTQGAVTQTQRMGASAGVTKAEQAEFRNHPLAGKLTRSLPKTIQLAFLSYARQDAQFVLGLAKDLRAGGAGVWIDQLDITPGQRWDRAVEDALAKCPELLVILSPAAVESTNVMDEVSLALEDGKTVVPVLHRQCKIPFRLRRLQYVDFSLNYKAGLDRLLETLGVAAPGTVKASGPLHIARPGAEQEQPPASAPEMPEDAAEVPTQRRYTLAGEEVRTQRRYTLAGEVALFMPEETETTEEQKRAVAYFAVWIERNQRDVKTILETLPILMRSLRWGVKLGMAAEVMRITRSLEFALVLNGRWESWTNTLCLAAQSAIAEGDKAALGWVRHQNGTKTLCEGNLPEARESLEQALQIREELRDTAGAGVTRHNLNLVAPPPIPPWKLWKLFAGFGVVICAFIVAMAFASKFHLWSPSATPAPTVTSTATPALTLATPALTVTSTATPAPASATPAPTVTPTEITTPLSATPMAPSIIPTMPLNPPPLVRIVRFTGTPTTIVRGESARLSYRLQNAERASIDPSVGEIGPIEGDLSVSPEERTIYTLTAFGRDGATQRQQVMINIRPRQRTGATRETQKKREKDSPSPGPHLRVPPAGARTPTPAPRLQIGIGRGAPPPP